MRFWKYAGALLYAIAATVSAQAPEVDPRGASKPWMRMRAFYEPRAYPFDEVPANAWQNAWQQAAQLPNYYPIQKLNGGWGFYGPDSTSSGWLARVNAIAVDPVDPNVIYIGVAKGGVWKSSDGGTSWANLTDTLASQSVGCIALDPTNPDTVYLGTGEEYYAINTLAGVGIYKSTTGGASWSLLGNSTFAGKRINAITVDPSNTLRMAVCTDFGIYTSEDGGANFTLRLSGWGSALRRHPTTPSTLYGAIGAPFTGGLSANGVYKSTDNGLSWTLQTASGLPSGATVGRIELDIAPSDGNTVYVAFAQNGNAAASLRYELHSIWKTTTGGSAWSNVTNGAGFTSYGQCWYDFMVRVHPTDPTIAFVGDVNVWRTTNGGTSWTNQTPDHPDIHTLEFHPTTPSTLFLGEDAGLYKSTTTGASWSKLNTGRGTMEFYAFDIHPTDAGKLVAGAQDNATQVRNGSNTYSIVIGGDGFWCAYKQSDPSVVLGEVYYAIVYRSTNGGTNWSFVFDPGDSPAPWSAPLVNSPVNTSTFYVGTYRVWRSTTNGAFGSWSFISPDLCAGGTLRDIEPSASDGLVLYTGASTGKVYRTGDGGTSWQDRTAGLPTRAIGGIAVHPTDPNKVYAGLMGFGSGHVFKSTDGGVNWTDISGNLPNTPVNDIKLNPLSPNQVFVATDTGVFTTVDGGASWTVFDTGLPMTPCLHLKANGTTGHLYVATYGRGIWRSGLPSALIPTSTTVAAISATYGETIDLAATLVRTDTSAPLSGKSLEFTVDGSSAGSAATNGAGIATVPFPIGEALAVGIHPIQAAFGGDATFAASSGGADLTILKGTTTTVAADVSGANKTFVNLSATVTRNSDGAPVAGDTVRFRIDGLLVGSGVTNASGVATFSYKIPGSMPDGAHVLKAVHKESAKYLKSKDTATLTVL